MRNPTRKLDARKKAQVLLLTNDELQEALYAFYVLTDPTKTKEQKLDSRDFIDPLYEEGYFTRKLVITKKGINMYKELLKEMKSRKVRKKNG